NAHPLESLRGITDGPVIVSLQIIRRRLACSHVWHWKLEASNSQHEEDRIFHQLLPGANCTAVTLSGAQINPLKPRQYSRTFQVQAVANRDEALDRRVGVRFCFLNLSSGSSDSGEQVV